MRFQSAPPCGGRRDILPRSCILRSRSFQSAPPCGGRLRSRGRRPTPGKFQSAPPCGGRLFWSVVNNSAANMFQSAPPCGGRPGSRLRHDGLRHRVSIRAPVRGATRRRVSIGRRPSARFNPRPRAGGDPAASRAASPTSFNPRPRAGGDLHGASRATVQIRLFQSAPPCGGRLVQAV